MDPGGFRSVTKNPLQLTFFQLRLLIIVVNKSGMRYVKHESTQDTRHVKHESTSGTRHEKHESTQGTRHMRHNSTQGTRQLRHKSMQGTRQLRHKSTQSTKHVRYEMTQSTRHLRRNSTQDTTALTARGKQGTSTRKARNLVDSCLCFRLFPLLLKYFHPNFQLSPQLYCLSQLILITFPFSLHVAFYFMYLFNQSFF